MHVVQYYIAILIKAKVLTIMLLAIEYELLSSIQLKLTKKILLLQRITEINSAL